MWNDPSELTIMIIVPLIMLLLEEVLTFFGPQLLRDCDERIYFHTFSMREPPASHPKPWTPG